MNEQENDTGAEHHVIDDHVYSDIENCSMIDNDIIGEDLVEVLGYDTIIGEFLLDLLENFNVSTKVTCFASEKKIHLLCIESNIQKCFTELTIKSSNAQLDYDPKAILFSKSPLQLACKIFSSKKALSPFS